MRMCMYVLYVCMIDVSLAIEMKNQCIKFFSFRKRDRIARGSIEIAWLSKIARIPEMIRARGGKTDIILHSAAPRREAAEEKSGVHENEEDKKTRPRYLGCGSM